MSQQQLVFQGTGIIFLSDDGVQALNHVGYTHHMYVYNRY
jgi:hypothetical protein